MGSVLVTSQNNMEDFSAMPILHPQPVSGAAPLDPDLTYLQEKLLRDEWMKLMRYTKKKKKKKKEKDKEKKKEKKEGTDKDEGELVEETLAQNSSQCPLLRKALTTPEKNLVDEADATVRTVVPAVKLADTATGKQTANGPSEKPSNVQSENHRFFTAKSGANLKRFSISKTFGISDKKFGWAPSRKSTNTITSGSDSDEDFDDARETLTSATSKSCSTKGFSTADEYDFDEDDADVDKVATTL